MRNPRTGIRSDRWIPWVLWALDWLILLALLAIAFCGWQVGAMSAVHAIGWGTFQGIYLIAPSATLHKHVRFLALPTPKARLRRTATRLLSSSGDSGKLDFRAGHLTTVFVLEAFPRLKTRSSSLVDGRDLLATRLRAPWVLPFRKSRKLFPRLRPNQAHPLLCGRQP